MALYRLRNPQPRINSILAVGHGHCNQNKGTSQVVFIHKLPSIHPPSQNFTAHEICMKYASACSASALF